ncbi:Endoplasmic reticulum vesicle protein 25 [Gracilariopsis chorda]|uniref:Endoplasmic reticulum vesicle protein 25 n=1 Tax=Gracilariopsis chorda TaxID=448386 RepID=A0A2V3J154_9FLOR|nr:Endoplasmic reticulum vesicle protein 25 [Gracilariopsis chorda]|eukprot:PXF48089.1 Endoplasmic reticulum vesicle protein 25 [Gracilariopsis chorda]
MPVDITVTVNNAQKTLLSRQNVDHGKFAFVVPYPEGMLNDIKVASAEAHRKKMRDLGKHINERTAQINEDASRKVEHHRRHVLSVDKPSSNEGGAHRDHPHHDYYGYGYDDNLDDFDMDEYDGINDDSLEDELARNQREHMKQFGAIDAATDQEKEEQLFQLQKFEICVSTNVEKQDIKRRVRLIINRGEAAHDFTRLAKKEHLTHLEVSLRHVSSELNELLHVLEEAREMEDILRKMNENTNKRVVLLSVMSLISLFAVGGYQAVYTKKFFKRKKIL